MRRLSGKIALVTGASSGIGRAIAERLAAEGAEVITAQRRPSEGFESLAADFLNEGAPAAVMREISDRWGRLDILINNAGLMREGTAEETSLEDWHAQLAVNLTAPFLLIRHALPLMRAAGGGAIVNIGSIEGLGANPRHPGYGASKAGLHGLTRAVAVDHGPDGVRCNAVAPGWIDTELNEDFIDQMPDPARFREEIGRIHPLRRTGTPQDVAALVSWLASDDAHFATGQVYTLDGGRTAQLSLP